MVFWVKAHFYNQPLTTFPLTFDLPRDGLPWMSTRSTSASGGFNVASTSFFFSFVFGLLASLLAPASGFGGSAGDFTDFDSVFVATTGAGATPTFAGDAASSGIGVGAFDGASFFNDFLASAAALTRSIGFAGSSGFLIYV
jgi:hypothetical protein